MRQQSKKQNQGQGAKVKIIPLGGLEQIGLNITAIEYEDNIIVVDCGLAFPSDDMLGIDLCIPDVTYLKQLFKYILFHPTALCTACSSLFLPVLPALQPVRPVYFFSSTSMSSVNSVKIL